MIKPLTGPAGHSVFESVRLSEDFPFKSSLDYRFSKKGAYLSVPHRHEALEIGWCRQGEGLFRIAEKVYSFKPDDVFVISPQEAHCAEGEQNRWDWFFFDPVRIFRGMLEDTGLSDLSRLCGAGFDNLFRGGAATRMAPYLHRIRENVLGPEQGARDSIKANLLVLLVDIQRRRNPDAAQTALAGDKSDDMARLEPALRRIQQRYPERINLPDLARLCHMSLPAFRLRFRKTMGKSPYQYLMLVRLKMAQLGLHDKSRTVEDIAYACGFPTLSCFVRKFRKEFGKAPRAWGRGG